MTSLALESPQARRKLYSPGESGQESSQLSDSWSVASKEHVEGLFHAIRPHSASAQFM